MFKLIYVYYGTKEFIGTYDAIQTMISNFVHEKVLDVKEL